jgi:hypothetical protein
MTVFNGVVHDDDWAAPYRNWLMILALVFGGLSVIVHFRTGFDLSTGRLLSSAIATWDSVVRVALSPMQALLERVADAARDQGFAASLMSWWPHTMVVAILSGLSGVFVAHRFAIGLVWLVACLAFGVVIAAGIDVFGIGQGIFVILLMLGALLMLMMVSSPELFLLSLTYPSGVAVFRVVACFAGALLLLLADMVAREIVR